MGIINSLEFGFPGAQNRFEHHPSSAPASVGHQNPRTRTASFPSEFIIKLLELSVHPSPHLLAQITSHTHENNKSYPATGSLTICTAELVCSCQFVAVILGLPKLHSDFSVLVIIPLLNLVSR